jgi:hypothetical protein
MEREGCDYFIAESEGDFSAGNKTPPVSQNETGRGSAGECNF